MKLGKFMTWGGGRMLGGFCCGPSRMASGKFEMVRHFSIVLLLLLAGATSVRPTTFARVSLEQLSSAAPLIVRAHCQGSIVSSVKGEIWTITSFEVREVWKGRCAGGGARADVGGADGGADFACGGRAAVSAWRGCGFVSGAFAAWGLFGCWVGAGDFSDSARRGGQYAGGDAGYDCVFAGGFCWRKFGARCVE